MMADQRIRNETEHGRLIARKGEEIWNWSSPAGKIRWQRRVEMFRSFLGSGNRDVLEIGCGTGLFTQELCKTGHRITAIDISAELLELARQRNMSGNVRFLLENAYATSFSAGSFDFVVGSSCLHHLDLMPALQEFHRLLRPGGRLMFTEPNMLNPQIAMQKNIPLLKRLAGDSPDETAFLIGPLKRALTDKGFREVEITPFDFIHPSIPKFMLEGIVPILNSLEKLPLVRGIAGSLLIRAAK